MIISMRTKNFIKADTIIQWQDVEFSSEDEK